MSDFTLSNTAESQDLHDDLARTASVYGFRIIRLTSGRRIEIETSSGPREVVDCATNGPFGLNRREEVIRGAVRAIKEFGAVHASIATARGVTALSHRVATRVAQMKGGGSAARIYPTTLSANIAAAYGFAPCIALAVVHPHAHATMQLALKSALKPATRCCVRPTPWRSHAPSPARLAARC